MIGDGRNDISDEVQRLAHISERNYKKALRAVELAGRHRSSPFANVFSSDED